MVYFRYVSLVLGLYILLAWLWILIFPDKYRKLAERFLPEKKPLWFSPLSWAWVLWILYTWYRWAQFQTLLSLAVTLVLSLTVIKAYYILFKYPQFREFARTFVSSATPVLRTLALIAIAVGILLTAIGLTI